MLVSVNGPCEVRRARERIDEATIEVIMRPMAGLPGPVERELEQLLCQTLEHLVLTADHPRTAISVVVQVLANDGALLAASLHGATLALVHAGVPMRGLLGACTVGVLPHGTVILDPSADEERAALAIATLAYVVRRCASGAYDRKLVLSHVCGCLASADQYDVCLSAAQEAAICAVEFERTAVARTVAPAPAAPGRGE